MKLVWHPYRVGVRRAGAALIATFVAIVPASLAHAAPPAAAVTRAAKYLVAQQKPDGSWTESPAVEDVAAGVVALVSAGVTDTSLVRALNYLSTKGPAEASRPAITANVILAAVAAGRDPRDFGHVDYVGRLRTYYNPNNGNYDPGTDPNSWAILAMVAAREAIPERAITSLQARQCGDGGLPRGGCLFGSDVSSTGLGLNALAAAGVGASDPVYAKARTYLLDAQNNDGGFGDAADQATVAVATGAAIGAIVSMGEDPGAAPWVKSAGHDAFTALAALQDSAGGLKADGAAAAGDAVTTANALPGLAGYALPVRPAPPTPPSTSTTAGPAANATSTTLGGAARRLIPRTTRTSAPALPAVTTSSTSKVALAAPASRGEAEGRSFLTVLPFVATLFGAGSVGLVLRRRARI